MKDTAEEENHLSGCIAVRIKKLHFDEIRKLFCQCLPHLIQFFQSCLILCLLRGKLLAFYGIRVHFLQCKLLINGCVAFLQPADLILCLFEIIFALAFLRLLFLLFLPA